MAISYEMVKAICTKRGKNMKIIKMELENLRQIAKDKEEVEKMREEIKTKESQVERLSENAKLKMIGSIEKQLANDELQMAEEELQTMKEKQSLEALETKFSFQKEKLISSIDSEMGKYRTNIPLYVDLEYLKTRIQGLQLHDIDETLEMQFVEKYFNGQERQETKQTDLRSRIKVENPNNKIEKSAVQSFMRSIKEQSNQEIAGNMQKQGNEK